MESPTTKIDPDAPDEQASPAGSEIPTARRRMPDLLQRPFDIRSVALSGLFVLALFYTTYFMRSILLPIVLAFLLSSLLRPLVRGLARARISCPIGAAIILLSLITALGYGISLLGAPAAAWLEKAPYSFHQLQQKLMPLQKPIERVTQASGEVEKLTAPGGAETKPAVEVKQHPVTDALFLRTPEFLAGTATMIIMLYFLLAYDGVFLPKLIKLIPRLADKKRAVAIAHDVESHISRYLLTVTLINISLGIAVGTAVGFLGLRNPIMWGAMVAVLNFVPYLGALTGIVCMTLGAVLSYDNFGHASIFPGVYLLLAMLEGNFVTPWVMGKSLTLNPVLILLSITFWGWMWGVAGVILAVPILAAFKIFCTYIEPMEPVAEFLS